MCKQSFDDSQIQKTMLNNLVFQFRYFVRLSSITFGFDYGPFCFHETFTKHLTKNISKGQKKKKSQMITELESNSENQNI